MNLTAIPVAAAATRAPADTAAGNLPDAAVEIDGFAALLQELAEAQFAGEGPAPLLTDPRQLKPDVQTDDEAKAPDADLLAGVLPPLAPVAPGTGPVEAQVAAIAAVPLAARDSAPVSVASSARRPAISEIKDTPSATKGTEALQVPMHEQTPTVAGRTNAPTSVPLDAANVAVRSVIPSDSPTLQMPAATAANLSTTPYLSPVPSQMVDTRIATARIETPLGSPNWGDDFVNKVTWLVNDQQQTATLKITPPHLGPVEVSLTIADDFASVSFVSPHAVVRDAIESSLASLREALASGGMQLGNATVSAEHRQGQDSGSERPGAGNSLRNERAAGPGDPALPQAIARRVQVGLIDTFV